MSESKRMTNGAIKNKESLTYISTNDVIRPKINPPITVPSKLSRPPTTAAIKI